MVVRDKDTDTTWLYGPWKWSASFGPSAYQLRPGQPTCKPLSIRAQGPSQKKLGTGVHQGILLAPDAMLSYRLTQRKVWFNPQIPQICIQGVYHHFGNSSGRLIRERNHTESVSARKYSNVSISRRISPGCPFSATK